MIAMNKAIALAAIVAIVALALHLLTIEQKPALAGYGCNGASGVIYADHEDHFPICDRIEPND